MPPTVGLAVDLANVVEMYLHKLDGVDVVEIDELGATAGAVSNALLRVRLARDAPSALRCAAEECERDFRVFLDAVCVTAAPHVTGGQPPPAAPLRACLERARERLAAAARVPDVPATPVSSPLPDRRVDTDAEARADARAVAEHAAAGRAVAMRLTAAAASPVAQTPLATPPQLDAASLTRAAAASPAVEAVRAAVSEALPASEADKALASMLASGFATGTALSVITCLDSAARSGVTFAFFARSHTQAAFSQKDPSMAAAVHAWINDPKHKALGGAPMGDYLDDRVKREAVFVLCRRLRVNLDLDAVLAKGGLVVTLVRAARLVLHDATPRAEGDALPKIRAALLAGQLQLEGADLSFESLDRLEAWVRAHESRRDVTLIVPPFRGAGGSGHAAAAGGSQQQPATAMVQGKGAEQQHRQRPRRPPKGIRSPSTPATARLPSPSGVVASVAATPPTHAGQPAAPGPWLQSGAPAFYAPPPQPQLAIAHPQQPQLAAPPQFYLPSYGNAAVQPAQVNPQARLAYADGPAGPARVQATLNGRVCESALLDSCSVAHVITEAAAREFGVEWRRASSAPLRGYGMAPIVALGIGTLALEIGAGGAPVSVPVVVVPSATTDIPVLLSEARLKAAGALWTGGPAADGGYYVATPGAAPARLQLLPDAGALRVAAVTESVDEVQVQWRVGSKRGVDAVLAPSADVNEWLSLVLQLASGEPRDSLVCAVGRGQPVHLYVPPMGQGTPAVTEEPYSVRGPAGCTDDIPVHPWLGKAAPAEHARLMSGLRDVQASTGIFFTGDPARDGHTFPGVSACPPMDVHLRPDVDFSKQPKPRMAKGAHAELCRAAGLAMLSERRGRRLIAPQGCAVSVIVVPKTDDTGKRTGWRLVYDFRFQNRYAIPPQYTMPSPPDCAMAAALAVCWSRFDAYSAFLQVTLARESCHLSSTAYAPGLFVEPLIANMGQVGAPAVWQSFIDSVLPPYPASPHVNYIDDSLRLHFVLDPRRIVDEILDTVRRYAGARISLKVPKLMLAAVDEIQMAGLRVRHLGIGVPHKRLAFVVGAALPASVAEARSLLAFLNAWRMFALVFPEDAEASATDASLLGFAALQRPIEEFLKAPGTGPLNWDLAPEARDAMRALMDGLPRSSRELFPFTPSARTCIVTDASPVSMVAGWQVWQRVDGRWRLVFCDSFMLTDAKSKRWERLGIAAGAFDAELTAAERCVDRTYPYLVAAPGTIEWISDAQIVVDGVNNLSFRDPATVRRAVNLMSLLPLHCNKVPREYMAADILCLKWKEDPAAVVAAADASESEVMYSLEEMAALRSSRGLAAPSRLVLPLLHQSLAAATAADELGALFLAGARGEPVAEELRLLKPREVGGRIVLSPSARGDVWYIPASLRGEALHFAHDRRMHPGSEEVVQHLLGVVWWPGLRADVKAYTAACTVCARDRVTQARQVLGAIPIPTAPGEEIHMDICHVGGVPDGVVLRADAPFVEYVVVAVDALTSVTYTRPLAQLTAVAAGRAIRLLVCDFRTVPAVVVLDGDPVFSPLLREGFAASGVGTRVVAPHAHQGNLAERAIRHLREMSARAEHEVGWRDPELHFAEAAAQHSMHWSRVVNRSPWGVLTGVEPVGELSRMLGPVPTVAEVPGAVGQQAAAVAEAEVAEAEGEAEAVAAAAVAAPAAAAPPGLLEAAAAAPMAPVADVAGVATPAARFAAAAAAKAVSRAQGRAIRNRHRRAVPVAFASGDEVWLRVLTGKVRSAQTARRWDGPFRVVSVFDSGNSAALETLLGERPARLAKVSCALLRRAAPTWDGAPAAGVAPPPEPVKEPTEYVVDRIVGHRNNRRRGNREEWHVIWKGFPVSAGSWEPRANLRGNAVWRAYQRERGQAADSGSDGEVSGDEGQAASAVAAVPHRRGPPSPLFARAPVVGDSDDDSVRHERRRDQASRRGERALQRRERRIAEDVQ